MDTTQESDELNMTEWSNFMEKSVLFGRDFKMVYIVILGLVFTASLFVNLLTCLVIYFDKTMHTVTNYYLFSLAVSDLTLTFIIFLVIYEYLRPSYSSEMACKIQFFGVMSLWNYSVLTMTALSIERYMAICHPMKVKSSPNLRRVMKIIAVMWLVAAAEAAPDMMTIVMVKMNTFQPIICFTVPTVFARIVNGALAIITFFIPLLITTFAYFMIILKVNSRRKMDIKNRVLNSKRRSGKINKLIVVMSGAFLVCWMPHFMMRVLIAVSDPMNLMNGSSAWTVFFRMIAISNWLCVVLNPIIFSLVSSKFRRSLKGLWNSTIQKRSNK